MAVALPCPGASGDQNGLPGHQGGVSHGPFLLLWRPPKAAAHPPGFCPFFFSSFSSLPCSPRTAAAISPRAYSAERASRRTGIGHGFGEMMEAPPEMLIPAWVRPPRRSRPHRPSAAVRRTSHPQMVHNGQMVHNVALVLGGGGAAGNAWEIGIIAGLAEAGLDMTETAGPGDRHLGRCHRGSAGAQRYTSGRTAGLGAVPAGSTGRTEPGTAAVPADGRGVRADEGHRRRRHLGSRSATCDGRVRVGERLHTRTWGGTATGNGRRPVAPP